MLVLGIESSTPVASVALVSHEGLIGEVTLNIGLTHSEQLLPLIDNLLLQTRLSIACVEGIAVAQGPGSFTGLRIGMATAKGLAQGRSIPLAGIPTLKALAYTQAGFSGLVAPVMNARRQEIYAGLFRFSGGKGMQLIPDLAVDPLKWAERLMEYREPVLFTGDGLAVYQKTWEAVMGKNAVTLPAPLSLARAATVAWLGREKLLAGFCDNLYTLKPVYLRPVDAQARLQKEC